MRAFALLAAAALLLLAPAPPAPAADAPTDLLPALQPDAAVLADHDVVKNPQTGQLLLRFSNAIANVGAGPLTVVGFRDRADAQGADPNDDTMPAFERLLRSDGSTRDVPVGTLVYHPEHHHFHFFGAARYQLLDGATGAVLREAPKVSFCLADVAVVDDALPGFTKHPVYNSCAHDPGATSVTMGVSVGWEDIYEKRLDGQAFDVSDLMSQPQHDYVLVTTTNPLGLLLEGNAGAPASVSVHVTLGQGVDYGTGTSRPGV